MRRYYFLDKALREMEQAKKDVMDACKFVFSRLSFNEDGIYSIAPDDNGARPQFKIRTYCGELSYFDAMEIHQIDGEKYEIYLYEDCGGDDKYITIEELGAEKAAQIAQWVMDNPTKE